MIREVLEKADRCTAQLPHLPFKGRRTGAGCEHAIDGTPSTRLAPDLDRHCQRAIDSAIAFGMTPKVTAEEIERLAWDGIEQFPDLIVARLFGFGPRDLLEFEATEIADVDVKQLFET